MLGSLCEVALLNWGTGKIDETISDARGSFCGTAIGMRFSMEILEKSNVIIGSTWKGDVYEMNVIASFLCSHSRPQ